jgi:putative glutathione S-transferase
MTMPEFDYEIVNGRKIRVRPRETVSEIDANGYFRRQPNHFTRPFGDGPEDLKAEGNGRYRLVWAKLCHWSNRASIVRELEGLEDQISVNLVEHAPHEKNLGWEYVYNEDCIDPILGDQFLSEAYYRADDSYAGRTTVPALIDTRTGQVVNNDYNWLTNYLEVQFRPWHKKGAPELYPKELREEIDRMNLWLFDNINNAVYRCSFSRSPEGRNEAFHTLYAALDRLEKRLETNRFLFGDYVTDSDVRLYVTLARLDIRYTWQIGETKHPLFTYKNLWGYARELWQIPAFRNNTYFADFAEPEVEESGIFRRSFNYRFLKQIDFERFWGAPTDRARLSDDPLHKLKAETDGGTAREEDYVPTPAQRADEEAYAKLRAIPSTRILEQSEEENPTVKDPSTIPPFVDTRAADEKAILEELRALPDGPEVSPAHQQEEIARLNSYIDGAVTQTITGLMTAVQLQEFIEAYETFYAALERLDHQLAESRFLLGDFVTESDVKLFVSLARFDIHYARHIGPTAHRIVDYKHLWPYLRDLYQIPAFAHHTDLKKLTASCDLKDEGDGYWPSTYFDIVLPQTDLDARWKVGTERAYLSSDPTHPILLTDNRRFDLDPSWYDLGAEQ